MILGERIEVFGPYVQTYKYDEAVETQSQYPESINSAARRALYDNLGQDEALADRVDTAIREVKKANWRGNRLKEREVRYAIKDVLGDDVCLVDQIFEIVKNQHDY